MFSLNAALLLGTVLTTTGFTARDTVVAAVVSSIRETTVSRTDTVQTSNSISITDAFASVPGIYVADYGGLAGLKSVSLRGMGNPHAAIYVDGVRVGNVQSGQADLGMLDLGNSSDVVIDYARNSISFNTAKPVFGSRKLGGAVKFRGGSFGTYEPSGRLDFKLSDRLCLSATAGGVLSKGDFPLADGSRRLNNDIRQIRTGLDSWGIIEGGDWHAKAYFNGAGRGVPGTPTQPSTDRQNDRNAFLQGIVHEQFSPLYALEASAKLSYDKLEYSSVWGDNFYNQAEARLNTSHNFSVCRWFDASLSADVSVDRLVSDLYDGSRTSVSATASAAFHPKHLKADIVLEYAGISDKGGCHRNILSPKVDLRLNAFKGFDLLAFARRAYRAPTFNELYYPGYGNPELEAEDAWLTGLGVEYAMCFHQDWHLKASAEGFFNYLKDKIISAPTAENPNIWLPYNIGAVQMSGADLRASVDYSGSSLKGGLSARYSYQNALDKTPGSNTFGQQIPFISKHTVILDADVSCKGWTAVINWAGRSGRYDSAGRMPDYHTLDLTAGKEIALPGDLALALKFIARNLTDCRYELAGGYPMPGRSFLGSVELKF